ncbi:hypothetical protein ACH5RR_040545 [Cinchona calisaya]|uniref:RING-type E3 ubiquitin transferase n=1 Tax=Cinchona calisaya TaxID=153742 RepID=A0ABD2XSW8_9GENT
MSSGHTLQQSVQAPELPPITIIITIIFLVFFFVGFFSIYFCRCFMQNLLYSWHLRHSPADTPVVPINPQNNLGIDPKIIESFPTFTYSSVKDYRKEKYGLECAICLVEFRDDDVLRLLTACCHVFHQECIDLWLEKHKTCPVCRRSLDTVDESPEKSSSPISFTNTMRLINENNEALQDSFCITIKDENDEDERGGNDQRERTTSSSDHNVADNDQQVEGHKNDDNNDKVEKFSRSHSTGHSIVRRTKEGDEEEDRYTLRLPEEIQEKIIQGHKSSRSCTTFGEFKSQETTKNVGFGEVSGGDINKV